MGWQVGFLEIGGLEGFKKIAPVVEEYLRLDQDDVGDGKGLEREGHRAMTVTIDCASFRNWSALM